MSRGLKRSIRRLDRLSQTSEAVIEDILFGLKQPLLNHQAAANQVIIPKFRAGTNEGFFTIERSSWPEHGDEEEDDAMEDEDEDQDMPEDWEVEEDIALGLTDRE